jgi:uncharacterized membrane protein|tara:strand:- start:675 stop:1064 length:390 start_codon:yes stop_codon:yes gene_type:complete
MKKRNSKKPIHHRAHPMFKIPQTFGQKAADKLTRFAGSWAFIILVILFIIGWICLNITAYIKHWDPWPFIILNLCLSCLAALQAPIILMSQNRQAEKDRIKAEYDYAINKKAEKEIREIKNLLMKRRRK